MERARPLVPARTDLRATSGAWTLVENDPAGLKPATPRAYGEDLAAFAAWTGAPDVAAACSRFTALPHGDANALAFEYRLPLVKRNPRFPAMKMVARRSDSPMRRGGR